MLYGTMKYMLFLLFSHLPLESHACTWNVILSPRTKSDVRSALRTCAGFMDQHMMMFVDA